MVFQYINTSNGYKKYPNPLKDNGQTIYPDKRFHNTEYNDRASSHSMRRCSFFIQTIVAELTSYYGNTSIYGGNYVNTLCALLERINRYCFKKCV